MRKLIIILFVACTVQVMAGGDNFSGGGQNAAMAGAAVTNVNLWSATVNQAGLAGLKSYSAGLSYESRFLLPEMGIGSFAAAYPTKSGTFGVSLVQYGYSLYKESTYSFDYGLKLSDRISGGIGLNYHSIHIANEEYGSKNAVTVELGIITKIVDDLYIGAHVFNPTKAKLSDYNDERIPSVFNLGLGYRVSDKVLLNVETEKDIDFPAMFKAGVEYHVVDILYLRGGVATNPGWLTFGLGLKTGNFMLDFSSGWHADLGFSPTFSMTYKLK